MEEFWSTENFSFNPNTALIQLEKNIYFIVCYIVIDTLLFKKLYKIKLRRFMDILTAL